jgi:hypothetical protein
VRVFLDFMSEEIMKYRPLLRGETGLPESKTAAAVAAKEASL